MAGQRLQVIALVSGGKDSLFSILHCLHHGHDVVVLANLFPPATPAAPAASGDADERDLNSFMYQTVGHQLVGLYAAATGIPLYRQPVLGRARCQARDYDPSFAAHGGRGDGDGDGADDGDDETESMVPLLLAIKARHPEANALCFGAILSNYQRTRVESVAIRLGLVPLSFLWKYPELPGPASISARDDGQDGHGDDTQLLRDMAAAGLDARIVKVASAGLDQSHLWTNVTDEAGIHSVKRALRRFGAAPGAVLGEGGEFETLVLDGPARLFRKRIVVPDAGRTVVAEGGGCFWLKLRGARLQDKLDQAEDRRHLSLREPALLSPRFHSILAALKQTSHPVSQETVTHESETAGIPFSSRLLGKSLLASPVVQWLFLADADRAGGSIEQETRHVVANIRAALASSSRDPEQVTNTIIVLRDMADFAAVNAEYGKLFTGPSPPSRVTISCGSLLPQGRSIMVLVAMPRVALEPGHRIGLHVQARSYWAPANIGPYSQAVHVPLTTRSQAGGPGAVYAAGQIPLMPASMCLASSDATCPRQQVVLALQHLWRIGAEMKVQCWASAVAYFARTTESDMAHRAHLASRAWTLAHASHDKEEEEEGHGDEALNSVDPWHLKYNHDYVVLGRGHGEGVRAACPPEWSVFTRRQRSQPAASCIPPVFAVEVESLPRRSDVEWHAHMGLAQVADSSVDMEMMRLSDAMGGPCWRAWHAIVRSGETALLLHTVLACALESGSAAAAKAGCWGQTLASIYRQAVQRRLGVVPDAAEAPYLAYVDATSAGTPWNGGEVSGRLPLPLVPCHSLWSPQAQRLACLALYQVTMNAAG